MSFESGKTESISCNGYYKGAGNLSVVIRGKGAPPISSCAASWSPTATRSPGVGRSALTMLPATCLGQLPPVNSMFSSAEVSQAVLR
jgi:hypothetical protein